MEKKKESIVLALIALIIGILALILSWVPIVNNFAAILAVIGFILAIIALIINRKNKKTLSIVSLVISIVAFVIVMATQAFYAKTLNDSFKSSENSSKVEKTSGKASVSESKESKKSDSNLLIDSKYKEIADQNGADTAVLDADKSYSVTWSDNSWAGLNISADKVDIIKVSGYKDYNDNEYQGFAIVHYNIDNTQKDLSVYPEQADVSTSTGLQTNGSYEMDHFAGDLMKGTKTSGYAAYPLKELNDVNDIKTLRISFTGSYETDNYDDDNSDHTYDFTLNLN